jgi:hypothetical protein
MKIILSPSEVRRLQKPIRGRGGFQVLLRKLQAQIDGNVLTLSEADLEKIVRYSFRYGQGGFEDRTKPTAHRGSRR